MIGILDRELLVFDEWKIIQKGIRDGYINWDMDIQSLFKYADMMHSLDEFGDYQLASLEKEWASHWENLGNGNDENSI